jgi:hypothetical protein
MRIHHTVELGKAYAACQPRATRTLATSGARSRAHNTANAVTVEEVDHRTRTAGRRSAKGLIAADFSSLT